MFENLTRAMDDECPDVTCNEHERENARRLAIVRRLDKYRQRLTNVHAPAERDAVYRSMADELAADHTELSSCAAALLDTRLCPPKKSYAWTVLSEVRNANLTTRNSESAACLRLGAQVAAHWGASIVERYAWTSRPYTFLERLWCVAKLHYDWTTAVRYLNAVLVLRHELVLCGELSGVTRSWQTIGNEVDKGTPRRCYSPLTVADLRNVLTWAEDGYLEIGNFGFQTLEEAEESVECWATGRIEDIRFRDGSCLSDRPATLWSLCMVAYDSFGLIVREDTLPQAPQRHPAAPRKPAKRPRLNDAENSTSPKKSCRSLSTDSHSSTPSEDGNGSLGTSGPSSASSECLSSVGDPTEQHDSRESSIDSQTASAASQSSDCATQESPGDELESLHSPDSDLSDRVGAAQQAGTASPVWTTATGDDEEMSNDDSLCPEKPTNLTTEEMHGPSLNDKTSTVDYNDLQDWSIQQDLRSPDCPICAGQCKAGFVPRSIQPDTDRHLVQQQRNEAFKSIHNVSCLVSERSASDAKSQTLNSWGSFTHLASIFFDPDEDMLSTASKDDADVWCLTSKSLQEYLESGTILERPVLVKDAVRDAGWLTWEDCQQRLGRKLSGRSLLVRNPLTHLLEDFDGDDLMEILNDPDSALNALDLPGLIRGDRPAFTLSPRYRLLEDLVHSEAWDEVKKQVTTKELDIIGCMCFNILGLRGAFSGAHLDNLNGTWVRSFCGRKAWMFVPPNQLDDDDFARLARDGDDYDPRGKARTILINPDEVFLMPPGAMVIHAVLTLETSLMEGSMLWDDLQVNEILENMTWIAKNQQATNEAWPTHIQAIVAQLDRAVVSDIGRFFRAPRSEQDFLREYEKRSDAVKALWCKCTSRCGRLCPCKLDRRRCTPECNSHAKRAWSCCKEQ